MTEKANGFDRGIGHQPITMDAGKMPYAHMGLTKREYFAGLAMQGMIANPTYFNPATLAFRSVEYADALLEELAKEE